MGTYLERRSLPLAQTVLSVLVPVRRSSSASPHPQAKCSPCPSRAKPVETATPRNPSQPLPPPLPSPKARRRISLLSHLHPRELSLVVSELQMPCSSERARKRVTMTCPTLPLAGVSSRVVACRLGHLWRWSRPLGQ